MPNFSDQQISILLRDCCEQHGWQLPHQCLLYMTQVLSDHMNKPDWQPQPSYAEAFMRVNTVLGYNALANECWFARAVFPTLLSRRGLNASYFVQMGQTCFDQVYSRSGNEIAATMRDHFEFLAEVAWTTVHAQGEWRSMWT